MASESVVSYSLPLPARPGSSVQGKAHVLQKKNSFEGAISVVKGSCFFCNEEGHWVRNCPKRSDPTSGSSPRSRGSGSYPEMQCPCGHGACIVLTSRTSKNPGRDFYRCPQNQSDQCGFFKWCDEANSVQICKSTVKQYQLHDGINILAKPAGHFGFKSPIKFEKQLNDKDHPNPMCSCGAGNCILLTVPDGENAGRKYFACPIKKGQGACKHFQWYDSSSKAEKVKHSDCFLGKSSLPISDGKDVCQAINFVKEDDMIAPILPLLHDQMFIPEQHVSTGIKELKISHTFVGQEGCINVLKYGSPVKARKNEHSGWLLDKPNLPNLGHLVSCNAVKLVKAEDMIASVSPFLQDQILLQEFYASTREREGEIKYLHYSFDKSDLPIVDDVEAVKSMADVKAEDAAAPPASPLPQGRKAEFSRISPVRRLSLEQGGSSSKQTKGMKFGVKEHID